MNSASAIPHRMAGGIRALWIVLIAIVVASFVALLYYGREIYQMAPPLPEGVMTTGGEVVFTGDQALKGQDVWHSIGGQQLGSVWGHGVTVTIRVPLNR